MKGGAEGEVESFQPGFMMVAGSPMRGPNSADAGQGYSWRCNQIRESVDGVPVCPGGGNNTLRLAVYFPQCWNGVIPNPAVGGDFTSHMTNATNNGRDCPETHPHRLPSLTMNIDYYVRAGQDSTDFRLASDLYALDQPGGYSAHADFLNGWDPQALENLMNSCLRPTLDCG